MEKIGFNAMSVKDGYMNSAQIFQFSKIQKTAVILISNALNAKKSIQNQC